MKWIDKTAEGQTLLEEELPNIRRVETDYEGPNLKSITLMDKRGTSILRITGSLYGTGVQIWIPKEDEKKEDE